MTVATNKCYVLVLLIRSVLPGQVHDALFGDMRIVGSGLRATSSDMMQTQKSLFAHRHDLVSQRLCLPLLLLVIRRVAVELSSVSLFIEASFNPK